MRNLQITSVELSLLQTALWELLERDPYCIMARGLATKLSLTPLRESRKPKIEPPAPAPAPALVVAMAAALAAPVLSAADRRLLADLKVTW